MATLINQATKLPIINGYVSVPDIDGDLRIDISTALETITGSSLSRFIINKQRFFELPVFKREDGHPEDWYQQLRDAASLY